MTRIRARLGAPRKAKARPVSRAARQLALAHHIERMVAAGEIKGYAEAASALGVTRARMTQVANLTLLAPGIQMQVLLGAIDIGERRLRPIVRRAHWIDQLQIFNTSHREKR